MTNYTEAQWAKDMEIDSDFADAIEDSFVDAVQRQTEATLEALGELTNTANAFLEFVNENEIADEGIADAFEFFCSEVGIDSDDADLLSDWIAENYLFEDEETSDDEDLSEATHVGSWTLAGSQGEAHVHDRGIAYKTLFNRYVIRHTKDGKPLKTLFADSAPNASKVVAALNAGHPIKEDAFSAMAETPLMESYVVNLKRSVGIYD
jgi:hypothetical protein